MKETNHHNRWVRSAEAREFQDLRRVEKDIKTIVLVYQQIDQIKLIPWAISGEEIDDFWHDFSECWKGRRDQLKRVWNTLIES